MDRIRWREKIRENVESGLLPRDFDVTRLIVGHPPDRTTCAGCGEVFFLLMNWTLLLTLALTKITGFIEIAKRSGRKSGVGQHADGMTDYKPVRSPAARFHIEAAGSRVGANWGRDLVIELGGFQGKMFETIKGSRGTRPGACAGVGRPKDCLLILSSAC